MRSAAFALLAALMVGVAVGQPQPAAPPKPLPHPDTVYAVAFSPDGKALATGCFDKAARVWDVTSGKELRTIAGKAAHQNLVVSVAYSADGSQLVTTSTDNTAKVWGLPSDKPVDVRQHLLGQGITRAVVSPDGKTFVAAAGLLPLKRWDATDVKKSADLGTHNGFVVGLQYAANGATLYSLGSGETDSTLKYWGAADGKELGGVGVGGKPAGMWVNPASGIVTTFSPDGSLRQWPATLPAVKAFANAPAKARQAVTSADGSQLLVALQDQSVRVWNPAAGGESKVLLEKLSPGFFQIALHPTNGTLAVSDVGKVKFFGPDGKPRGELPVQGFVSGMAFHPTEAKFQLVGVTGDVQTWALPKPDDKDKKEPKDAKPLASRPTTKSVTRAVFLPAANQAVTMTQDGTVTVWDTTDGKEAKKVRDLGKLGEQPHVLTLSKDGTTVAASARKVFKVWTVADGKEVATFPEQRSDVWALAFNADKTRLAVSTGNSTATVYALPGGQAEQFVVHKGTILGLAFHPTQPVLFTAGDDAAVRATPLAIAKYASDPVRFGKRLTGFANGASMLTAGTGEGVFKVNAASLATEATFGKSKAVAAVAANKANTLVAVAEDDGTVTVFNANNPAESASFKAPAKVLDLAFHPTLPQLAGALADKRAMTWVVAFDPAETKPDDKRFGTQLQEVPHDRATTVAYTPDGQALLTGGGDAALRSWKVVGEAARFTLTHPSLVNGAAFDKSGTLLATAGQDGIVRVFDLTKPAGTAPKAITAHVPAAPATPQPVYAVLFTPDAKQVISCSFDKSVKIHDSAAGTLVKEIKPAADKVPGHSDAVYCLALSPDGKTLASGSADRTVKLWNPATGELIRELKNTLDPKQKDGSHPGYVHGLKFTADGKTLVTAGTAPKNKGYLATWNVADGKQLTGQELDVGPIHAVDVRADGLLALGCGAKARNQSAADVVLLPMPK